MTKRKPCPNEEASHSPQQPSAGSSIILFPSPPIPFLSFNFSINHLISSPSRSYPLPLISHMVPKLNTDDANTLFIKGIPTSATNEIFSLFSNIGPIKQCFVVADNQHPGQNRGIGFVKFAIPEDTKSALTSNLSLLGNPLTIVHAKKRASLEERMAKKRKAPANDDLEQENPTLKKLKDNGTRLIVRNLSFSCTPKKLEALFSTYGKVLEAKIPTKPSGKYRGFGIVRFDKHKAALKALESVNETTIEDRVVAVDWCLPKDTYLQLEPGSTSAKTMEDTGKDTKATLSNLKPKREKAKKKVEKVNNNETESSTIPSPQSSPTRTSMDSLTETKQSEKRNRKEKKEKGEKKTEEVPLKTPDVDEKTTLFLRHVPTSCTKQDLLRIFKPYGTVVYVAIRPSDTPHTTAFVCYSTPEAAQTCLSHAVPYMPNATVQPELPPNYPFVIHHEVFAVHLALPKAELEKHHEQKQDKRYLYLLNEVPEMLVPQMKNKLKKCPDFLVSPTRLLIQHVPRTFTKADLRQLALQPFSSSSSSDTKSVVGIKQVVLVKGNEGRHKGYGFVEFREPEHALMCVRAFKEGRAKLAGVPELSVCFSIENRRILGLREKRIQFQKERLKKNKGNVVNVKQD